MAYIAVVDDEADIREILKIQLSKLGFEIKTFENGEAFLKSLKDQTPEIVLLDIMMDNMNGYEVLAELKRRNTDISVVFLTAKNQTMDKVLGLDLGAEDYITKPFQKEELIARIKTILRRKKVSSTTKPKTAGVFRYKTLVFNTLEKSLLIDNQQVEITKTEFLILKLLTSFPKKIFTRDEILDSVWKDSVVNERTIDVHIRRLRKKLGAYEDIIKTHSGFGYSIAYSEESPKND